MGLVGNNALLRHLNVFINGRKEHGVPTPLMWDKGREIIIDNISLKY